MTLYTPTPTYHDEVEIADDSSAPNASAFNPGLEGALDNAAYLKALADANKCLLVYTEYLSDETIHVPSNASPIFVYEGCGAGGGGGPGGASTTNGSGKVTPAGGGGGGAKRCFGFGTWPAVGESYAVVIGSGAAGALGGDTTCTRITTGVTVLTCAGAQAGEGSITQFDATAAGNTQYSVCRGGRSTRQHEGSDPVAEPSPFPCLHLDRSSQVGGLGVSGNWPLGVGGSTPLYTGGLSNRGSDSPEGFSGGLGGNSGAMIVSDASSVGGGAGGGGGAGPYGNGGKGGNGSDAVGAGSSAAPTAGEPGPPNSGAGGGGGGSAGACPGSTPGADSSPGGSGRLRIGMFIPMVP